jgi:hypothetical protein
VFCFDPLVDADVPASLAWLPRECRLGPHPDQYFLVQSYEPVDAAWKSALVAEDTIEVGYVRPSTLIVRAALDAAERLDDLSFTRWAGVFLPAHRISGALELEMGGAR